MIRPRKLIPLINCGKRQIETIFVKICSFGAQNAAIDEKGFVYVWGIK